MAYPRPHYDARSPPNHEQNRPSWPRPHYPPAPSQSINAQSNHLLDPESESSDVSENPGEDHRSKMEATFPTPLPPQPSKFALESPDAIQGRLRDLQRVEDYNIKKQDMLKAKRARKDDRIRRKREAQDERIKAIMEARVRRDDRVMRRRKAEDTAFERFDQDLEEEETNLRRRLKRLKRGLPVDSIIDHDRSLSSASMSPPGPQYSNLPPPAKRHQPGPPGHSASPTISHHRPACQGNMSAPPPSGQQGPAYSFLYTNHTPQAAPYGRSPTYSHPQSPINSTAPTYSQPPRPPGPSSDPASYPRNGHPASPRTSYPSALNSTSAPGPVPPRHISSTYDTRPPPPSHSAFAPINPPAQSSGFATINVKTSNTPPVQNATINRDSISNSHSHSSDPERSRPPSKPDGGDTTPTSTSNGQAGGKRTPSTTHPYQMSEAFANRHHHCERVDGLNRGIWTYFGSGGTKENPTAPAQEMYLRCNHDDCKRIDWRTVHGLQCHIVKNHEQPKGTIGSLEKALDRYGVPLSEIEAYEKQHGEGTAGTMADSKNMKMKSKPRDSGDRADFMSKTPESLPPTAQQLYRSNLATTLGNTSSSVGMRPIGIESPKTDAARDTKPPIITQQNLVSQPPSRFAAVNGSWGASTPSKSAEVKDVAMRDAPSTQQASPHQASKMPPKRDEGFWRMWPDPKDQHVAPPKPVITQSPAQVPTPSTSKTFNTAPPLTYSASTSKTNPIPGALSTTVQTANTPTKMPSAFTAHSLQSGVGKKIETRQEKDHKGVDKPQPPVPEAQKMIPRSTTEATPISDATIEVSPSTNKPAGIPQSDVRSTISEPVKTVEVQQSPAKEKESDPSKTKPTTKPDGEEGKRAVVQAPEGSTTTRISLTGRRGSSRRASLAANKAIEREKVPAETQASTEDQRSTAELEPDKDLDVQAKEEEEEEEIGDSITVAPLSKDKDKKDKDKKERERKATEEDEAGKTPTRRLPNGRFLRKSTR